jgi:hypothetical protein
MPNEFEKQVQLKMEELNFSPSDPVWEKIAEQIRQKKGKRRFIFFLLPLFLVTGTALWLNWADRSISKQQISSAAPSKNNHAAEKKAATPPASTASIVSTGQPYAGATKPLAVQPFREQNKKQDVRQDATLSIDLQSPGISNASTEDKKGQAGNDMPMTLTPGNDSNTNAGKDAGTLTDSSAAKEKPLSKPLTDSNAKKKIAKAGKKWEKVIAFQAGWSSYQTGLFGGDNARYVFASPVGSGTQAYVPAKVTNGAAFAIGAGFRRKIGERSFIGIGIQYHFYSTHNKVGDEKKRDTAISYNSVSVAVSNYYTSGQHDYINKYGFIEIPVTFNYRLFEKLPLDFSLGASLGHLLRTNALTFDPNAGIYYYNKDNIRRNSLAFFSSVEYGIAGKGRFKIKAGPLVQYTLSDLRKENRYGPSHLFFAGVKTGISF